MNEISRCCRVLGVKSGATLDEVKKAYRDLVQVWHPDRFSGNERLVEKAQEQLKQINLAYEFLASNAFENGVVVEPLEEESPPVEPETTAESQPEPQPRSRSLSWLAAVGAIIALGLAGASLLLLKKHEVAQSSAPAASTNDQVSSPDATRSNRPTTYPSSFGANPPYSKNILDSMLDLNGEKPVMDGDSVILNAPPGDPVQHIRSDHLVTPPFVARATVRLADWSEIRVYCGMGRLIFNVEKNPSELVVNDFASGEFLRVPGMGLVTSNAWHEIAWEVTESATTVALDGEMRYRESGNYAGIKGYPGIGAGSKVVEVKSFIVEAQQPPTPATVKGQRAYDGNLLSAMAPENNLSVTNAIDGLTLRALTLPDHDNRFKTTNQYRAPFTIRTRAKTDSTNLRLFCGPWMLTFNHGNRCRELTVKEGNNEKKVKDKGLIAPNEWHNFVWKIQEHGMTVEVDGEQRYHNNGDFRAMQARPGIGTLEGNRVTVDYFVVEKN